MSTGLLKKLGELLLPERFGPDQRSLKNPREAPNVIYNRLLHLAAQIDSHAKAAPYPHVARRLEKIAAEKRESAQQLKKVIDNHTAPAPDFTQVPALGTNHWERVKRDLEDQKALEDLLALYVSRLRAEAPEIADQLARLASMQPAHRETLAELMALADPQATQT